MSACVVSFAMAFDITVDGIGYNIVDRTAHTVTVSGWDENYFTSSTNPTNPNIGTGSGDVSGPVNLVLPWRVYHNGLYYKVVSINDYAFSDCTSMKTVTIPNSVSSIGDYAFQGCTNLQTVTVQWTKPLGISEEVFDGVDLSGVVLRVLSGYKTVYEEADVWKNFKEVRVYEDIDVIMMFEDELVKEICVSNWDLNNDDELSYREAMAVNDVSGAFIGNTEIKSFNEFRSFSGVTVLGQNAFKGCSSLESIQLPSYLTTIQKEAFVGCESLKSVTIYNKVTSIAEKAFYECANIETLTMSTAITTIGDYAFYGCAKLKAVSLPVALTTIGKHAFDGCSSIARFYLYYKVESIGEGAFANCTSCANFQVHANNPYFTTNLYRVLSKDGTTLYVYPAGMTTKNYAFPVSVVNIAPYALAGASNITSVTFNNVETIGDYAFDGCENLATVSFPESVKSVGKGAFRNCQSLYTLMMTDQLTSIGEKAFEGVAQGIRTEVKWTSPLSISNGTFSNFTPVTDGGITGRLFVPVGTVNAYKSANGWKWFSFIKEGTIADYAQEIIQFKDAKVQEICVANFDSDHDGYVTYDEAAAVTSIGSLFNGAEIASFDELQYFTHLTTIPAEAFANSTLTSVVLPNSVVTIGANAFAFCNKLKTFNVPASVKTIGNGVLKSCAALTAITVDEANANYTTGIGALFTKDHSTLLQFPAYSSYTNIMIPDGVKTIAPEAFLGASRLKTVSIYKSVQTIGEKAFANSSINKVMVYWTTPLTVPANTFEGVDVANATLNVPVGTESLYSAANVWKDFGTVEAFTDEYSDMIFADAKVEAICVSKWDTNGDGKMNGAEVKAVTDLGNAFTGNTEITSFEELKYFTGLTEIAANAFKGCTELGKVVLPSSIKTIGESAFEGCDKMTTELNIALVSIGKKAFYGCNAITYFYLRNNVAFVGEGAFAHCASLTRFIVQSGNTNYKAVTDILFNADNTVVIAYPAGKKAGDMNANEIIKEIYPYAFSGVSKMTSFNFNQITTIGDFAFEDCTGLKSIVIGSKVTTIGASAFKDCFNMQSIDIPANVTSIGEKAFNGMPASVRCQVAWNTPLSINDNTFSNYEELSSGQVSGILFVQKGTRDKYIIAPGWKFFQIFKEMSMADYDATIIDFADPLVEKLTVANWDADGDGHISYDEASVVANLGNVFTGQPITSFNELQYFTALTEIGDNAFKDTQLAAITMPEGITRFGKSSFQGTALVTFNRLPNLTEIGDSAFAYNSGFQAVSISQNIQTVGTGAFKGCPNLTAITVDANNANYSSVDGVLYNKAGNVLLQFPAAKTIGAEYVLSTDVTEIGEDAFTMSSQLVILSLHEGVTSIGANAFRACEALDSVIVAWHTPLAVPANTFSGVNVKNVSLSVPKGTLSAYKAASVWKNFRIDEYLDDTSVIEFADATVKAICVDNWDLDKDGELTVNEAKQAYSLGSSFQGQPITSFRELKYFTGLIAIPSNAFAGCTALKAIELPKTVKNIQNGAFSGCTSLTYLQIPVATNQIGKGILANCSSLTTISVALGNTNYVAEDGVLFSNNMKTLLVYPAGKQGAYEIPSSVETIFSYAFSGAADLTSVILPHSLKNIDEGGFGKCTSLKFISIPASVKSIQKFAFNACTSLKAIKVAWNPALNVENDVFYDFNFEGSRLYVPAGSYEFYAACVPEDPESGNWGSFAKILEYPNCDVNLDGRADMLDAVDIVKFVVGQPADAFDQYLADFDNDEEVTVADAVILVGKIAEGVAAPNIQYANAASGTDEYEAVTLTKDINNVLSLCVSSELPYTAFQFDLVLPELSEVTVAKLTERLKGHQMLYNKIGENTYRFAALSISNKTFAGNDGSVINILAGNPDLDEIMVENIKLVTVDGAVHRFDNITTALPTDIAETMGTATGVMEDGVYYSLSGMRVDHPTKGVYILNGKKVVIK